ncbi:AfsR/SARP family transcriptional regulator [Streptomyces sp. C8S0]|uniref:AfsR/SARP family transcriptional regulator n=1 Tax=Streptomyces sp. C8S0 TaxID=2585716 RepID=UPI001D04C310|nr:bacterial transcriptional activator domain-containing protein [Streptomyces sp. C8S0]
MNLEQGNDQNALKNLRRAVRRALRAATGITSQEFILLRGELHKLNHNLMETDLADFSENLRSAFSSSLKGEARESLTAVRNALSHYSGPFVQGRDFLWADAVREQLASQAVDAVLRLAREAERSSVSPLDRDTVLALLEQLSDIHPERERLAQHAIRLYQAAGRHDAAQHAYNRLERHLANLGLQPEPATQALIAPWTHTRQKP